MKISSQLQLIRSILINLTKHIESDINYYKNSINSELKEDMKDYIETINSAVKKLKKEEDNISKHIELTQE